MNTVKLLYLAAAVCFVVGLHLMNSPITARRGNRLSAAGMVLALGATGYLMVHPGTISTAGWLVAAAGVAVGTVAGALNARRVAMTAIPQLVSLFNAAGGGAAALIALHDVPKSGSPSVATVLGIAIGAVAFSGSLVAAAKLQGLIPSGPLTGTKTRAVAALAVVGTLAFVPLGPVPVGLFAIAVLCFGVAMVLPIGGADMPVVISLLNAGTGTAVAMAGFAIGNSALIISGALVGASGTILTRLMAEAMNRSVLNVVIGGFGTDQGSAGPGGGQVTQLSADDAAIQLAFARRVIVVPGYGLAAAQAQHELQELGTLLEGRGVRVGYAVHPVAGRMPGHMNVLLAEAGVPYTALQELEEANADLPHADVALVVGANDVTNPAARRPGTPVSGMPILDVDKAGHAIVIKRSMGHGYAGIDNELYTAPRTGMFFGDAKKALAELTTAVKALDG